MKSVKAVVEFGKEWVRSSKNLLDISSRNFSASFFSSLDAYFDRGIGIRSQNRDVYGYYSLVIPDNYVELHFQTTSFWIRNDPQYKDLIAYLRDMPVTAEA